MNQIKLIKKEGLKKTLISYADENYRPAQKLLTRTAKRAGFSDVIEYSPMDIDDTFKKEYEQIFANKRGNGLWIWKPYLIYKTLGEMNDGDILFYCDSGACFFRSAMPILQKLYKQDIWISVLPLKEKQFTKRETFFRMKCEGDEYKETAQVSGAFCAFKKSNVSMKFVKEWLDNCCDIRMLAPVDDKSNEEVTFFAHREDQSILSLLSKKYSIKAYSDPSQYGRLPEKYKRIGCEMLYYGNYVGQEDYPICIIHHRTKDGNRKVLFKQLMCAILPRRLGLRFIDNGR